MDVEIYEGWWDYMAQVGSRYFEISKKKFKKFVISALDQVIAEEFEDTLKKCGISNQSIIDYFKNYSSLKNEAVKTLAEMLPYQIIFKKFMEKYFDEAEYARGLYKNLEKYIKENLSKLEEVVRKILDNYAFSRTLGEYLEKLKIYGEALKDQKAINDKDIQKYLKGLTKLSSKYIKNGKFVKYKNLINPTLLTLGVLIPLYILALVSKPPSGDIQQILGTLIFAGLSGNLLKLEYNSSLKTLRKIEEKLGILLLAQKENLF